MAFTAVITSATQVGDELSVVVSRSDGVTKPTEQRYTISLLDPHAKATLEAQVRPTVTPVNDALIKENLNLLVKGLELDLTEPVVLPPDPPDPVVVQFLSDLQAFHRAKRGVLDDGLTIAGMDVDALRAVVQSALDKDATLARFIPAF